MNDIYTETVHRIYDNSESDAFIQIGPDADGLGLVRMSISKNGERVWGNCDLTMNKETVTALIASLNKSLEFAE
jgi:hypothetical protein